MSLRALLLINRFSRHGQRHWQQAVDQLRAAGVMIVMPDPSLSIAEAIDRHAAEVDRVIVGGGDGSLNAAADALIRHQLPLAILPLGTANDLARTLNLPRDLPQAIAVAAGHKLRAIDVGIVNQRAFFNVASIGFSASLAKNLTAASKKRWGVLGYALAAIKIFRQSRPFTLWLEHDGKREKVKTLQLSVGNGRFYGGGMAVAEDAAPDDGRLDVYSLELHHWWEMMALLPALRRGTQGRWRKVRAFPATALTVETRRPHDINADGEIVGTTPAHFSLRRHAVRVFVG